MRQVKSERNSVNTMTTCFGSRGRKFESSRPDQILPLNIMQILKRAKLITWPFSRHISENGTLVVLLMFATSPKQVCSQTVLRTGKYNTIGNSCVPA